MTYFDLGRHTRPISTRSAEPQRWFDLGLNWCFGFNHEDGVKCFGKALAADPGCVMAHWGGAYGLGPFYNLAWREIGENEAATAIALGCDPLGRARTLAAHSTALENRLVEVLAIRFQKAASCFAAGIRPLGRRLRGRDAEGVLRLSRRRRRQGAVRGSPHHPHPAPVVGYRDRAAGEGFGRG